MRATPQLRSPLTTAARMARHRETPTRPWRRLLWIAACAWFAVTLSTGCAAIVGDSCEDQTDCGQGMYCELSMPGGYCTVRACTERECPAEGVCVRFSEDVSYCMAHCQSDGDCRDDYRCVDDFGPHPFCNDAGGTPPGGG